MKPALALLFLAAALPHACAQAVQAGIQGSTLASEESASDASASGPAGIIPVARGYNFSVVSTTEHDSANGWSSLLSPNLAYRFTRHFSADVSAPIYTHINVLATTGTKARPIQTPTTKSFVPGDTSLSAHFDASPFSLDYTLTTSVGLPTGDSALGLGAGQTTYNVNNHVEKSFGPLSPDLEIGIADSSSLVASRIRKSYLSVGTLAHFQAGSSVALPHHLNFSADAYEELPIASQTLYSTTGHGKKRKRTAIGQSVAEDNGIATSLDLPLAPHFTLSGSYNRSLRSHIDTAGLSLTFLLKPAPRRSEE